jgi:hypothetical protein
MSKNENDDKIKDHLTQASKDGEKKTEDPDHKKRYYGKILVGIIIFTMIYEYIVYVYMIKLNQLKRKTWFIKLDSNMYWIITELFFFHLFFLMMVWCYIVTMKTHPGEIPLYWGFYIGDEDYKRKRYCLICNVFKPDRSHHCSVCNICVLNMDHHCPWVNNCIGFYNRKFFIQLLFYFLLLLIFTKITILGEIIGIVKVIYYTGYSLKYKLVIRYVVILVAYFIITVLTFLNSLFFRFHIKLVLKNMTTIETLDPEQKNKNRVCNLINKVV